MIVQQATFPNTINHAVNRLKGKIIVIRTPAEFARAIEQIERLTPAPAATASAPAHAQ